MRGILSGAGDGPFERDSQAWFAEQIKLHHGVARDAISKGDADLAARFAYHDGYLHAQAEMKWRWGTHALRGMKVLGGTGEEAQQTNLRNGRPREARFARMRVLVPEYGIDRAAAYCSSEGLGSIGAIKQQWNRYLRKKRDT